MKPLDLILIQRTRLPGIWTAEDLRTGLVAQEGNPSESALSLMQATAAGINYDNDHADPRWRPPARAAQLTRALAAFERSDLTPDERAAVMGVLLEDGERLQAENDALRGKVRRNQLDADLWREIEAIDSSNPEMSVMDAMREGPT